MAMKLGTTLMIKGKIAKDVDRADLQGALTDGVRRPALEPSRGRAPPPGGACIAINLGEGPEKLGLHFNPRYDQSTIVLNTFDGEWGKELVVDHLRFARGSEITVVMTFDSDGFKVTLPDWHQISFPNILGLSQLPYLSVEGGGSASPP
ncbi:galectin-2-like [Dasypus novemcinctus]|uniref:galectin-2-like n=1 Tax=Dasypus novemcinctus TaxID=9361 RepID=UPI00062A69D5|nr:galectin-2-like [Dasypus novemcinctus]